jgi:hypothetical protein
MQHIIRKQVIELTLDTDRNIFSVQENANRFYYETILPALEKILDGLTDENHIIQMERLEIDLGAIAWGYNQESIKMDEIYSKIEKAARNAVRQVRENGNARGFSEGGSKSMGKTKARSNAEAWLYYMRYGYLPWNVVEVNDQWRLHALEILATDHAMVTELRSLIESDHNAILRLINDHPVSFLVKLMEVITAANQGLLPSMIQEMEQLFGTGTKMVFQPDDKPAGKTVSWIWEEFFKGTVKGLSRDHITEKILEKKWIGRATNKEILVKDNVPLLWPVIENIQHSRATAINTSEVESNTDKNVQIPGDRDIQNKETGKKENEDKKGTVTIDAGLTTEGIFATHAGLIVLHPFLSQLFLRTGLVTNGNFMGRQEQEKAIWLLHFVVTGNESGEEHQLVVPKILCGYPLEWSPADSAGLDETSKTEAIDMIKAAIEQWTKLGNTSVEGLRETFLSRNGKMYKKNDDTCLAIEPGSYDMLLDSLPWNLSMIRLPWIKGLIRVEWR